MQTPQQQKRIQKQNTGEEIKKQKTKKNLTPPSCPPHMNC
jgi:hypothetical protein